MCRRFPSLPFLGVGHFHFVTGIAPSIIERPFVYKTLRCPMLLTELDFDLPSGLIATEPLNERDRSRMLCVDRSSFTYEDAFFYDLPDLLQPSDVIVVNNT